MSGDHDKYHMNVKAPEELWADWDYDPADGVCGVHTQKRFASYYEPDLPPIRYVRADRIKELEEALEEAVYLLNPTDEDMQKKAGVYRVVTALEKLKEKNT
jgi:hypothetical protein